jgi:hypothetical protein
LQDRIKKIVDTMLLWPHKMEIPMGSAVRYLPRHSLLGGKRRGCGRSARRGGKGKQMLERV